jgi:hypothetical protein
VFWFSVGNVQFAKLPDVGVPSAGVVSDGLACITNVVPVPVCDAIAVALPVDVIGPVKLALVASFPFNFWIACKIESVAATVPAPET